MYRQFTGNSSGAPVVGTRTKQRMNLDGLTTLLDLTPRSMVSLFDALDLFAVNAVEVTGKNGVRWRIEPDNAVDPENDLDYYWVTEL